MTRLMLERVQHIAAAMSVRKRTTAGMLAFELDVSRKTITRDIEFMRDRLNLPIDADVDGHYFREQVKLCRCCARRVRSC